MRIQFIYNNYEDLFDFDVNRVPTDAEVQAVYDSVYNEIEKSKELYGEWDDINLYDCCRAAVMKHLDLKENPVVKTFYIDRVND